MDRDDEHWKAVAGRMAQEDEAAVAEFAVCFGVQLRGFFLRKGFAPADAEDLTAVSIARAVSRIGLYRPQNNGSFSGWVLTIAWRARADWLREHVPTEPLSEDLAANEALVQAAEADPALAQAVEDAVGKLSAKARNVIRQRYLGGENSFAEIGQALGLSAGAARVQHLRALGKLAKILRDDPRVRTLRRSNNPRHNSEQK